METLSLQLVINYHKIFQRESVPLPTWPCCPTLLHKVSHSMWEIFPKNIEKHFPFPLENFLSYWEILPIRIGKGFIYLLEHFCQAQFKLASPVPVELSLALSLISTTHAHPHPHQPGKVEMQLEIDHIWSIGSWWKVCLMFFGGRG